jgi:hypothetical protein
MLHRVTFAVTVYATWFSLAHPNAARAQTAPTDTPNPPVLVVNAAAPNDFQRGLAALQAGDHAVAIDAFQASYGQDANPAALLNLGIAYTNSARPHDACRTLALYVERADATQDAASIQATRIEIDRLRRDNGVIELHLLPDVARVQLDGQDIVPEHGELIVPPGKRTFSVVADGYLPFDQTLDVQPGRFILDVQLKLLAAVSAPAAAQTVQSEPVSLPEPADEPETSAAGGCAMSEVCVGPVVALLGPPNLIGGGVHMRFGRYLGAGVDYQALPSVNISPITVGASLLSVHARVYPFGGAFFVGGGFGYQSIKGQLREGDVAVGAKAAFPAATANIGFMGHDGFVLGADLGLLFPLGTTRVSVQDMSGGKLAQDSASQTELKNTMRQTQDRVSQLLDLMPVFMQVNLIRVGYLF